MLATSSQFIEAQWFGIPFSRLFTTGLGAKGLQGCRVAGFQGKANNDLSALGGSTGNALTDEEASSVSPCRRWVTANSTLATTFSGDKSMSEVGVCHCSWPWSTLILVRPTMYKHKHVTRRNSVTTRGSTIPLV